MTWRVARSLNVLLEQLNLMYPHRSKVSDGSIGDAAHANRQSDHNPWYGPGIVTARDFTHDPDGGIDCHWLAGQLTTKNDSRIKYIIWNRKIWIRGEQRWKSYSGPNPHTAHLHLSVVASGDCDRITPWSLINKELKKMDIRLCRDSSALYRGIHAVTPLGYWKIPNEQALKDFCYKWGVDIKKVEDNDDVGWWGPNLGEVLK